METLTTKHQRLAALRPLSPESVASLAAARHARMAPSTAQFPEVRKLSGGGTSSIAIPLCNLQAPGRMPGPRGAGILPAAKSMAAVRRATASPASAP